MREQIHTCEQIGGYESPDRCWACDADARADHREALPLLRAEAPDWTWRLGQRGGAPVIVGRRGGETVVVTQGFRGAWVLRNGMRFDEWLASGQPA